MARGIGRANDYITRAEAHALIVHVINEVFAKMGELPVEPPTLTTEPADTTGALSE